MSLNWTSKSLPVTSLRENTSVQVPSFQSDLAAISPRSPVNGATMMPGTSSPTLYFESSNGSFSASTIQYGGAGLLPFNANFGPFLSSLTLSTYPPPLLGSLLRPASGDLSLSYRVASRY